MGCLDSQGSNTGFTRDVESYKSYFDILMWILFDLINDIVKDNKYYLKHE